MTAPRLPTGKCLVEISARWCFSNLVRVLLPLWRFLYECSPCSGLFGSISSHRQQTLVPGSLQSPGTKFLNATQVMHSLVSKAENKVATWQNGRGATCTLLQVSVPRDGACTPTGLHDIPLEMPSLLLPKAKHRPDLLGGCCILCSERESVSDRCAGHL